MTDTLTPTALTADSPESIAEKYREALSHFSSGVVIITAIGESGAPAGLTVGSFTSISLDPPLVGFFADHGSTTMPHVRSHGKFCVNILAAEQQTLAKTFARSGTDKFAEVAWTADQHGSPRLAGAHAWLSCTISDTHRYGDHDLIVGQLDSLAVPQNREPLVFHRSRFHGLGALG